MYLPRDDVSSGQGLVEYALLLVMVALIVLAILMVLGPQIANVFSRLTSNLSSL
jgi:pilus assembly protein Flp/PilA